MEGKNERTSVPNDWPSNGKIAFSDVKYALLFYFPVATVVPRNFSRETSFQIAVSFESSACIRRCLVCH